MTASSEILISAGRGGRKERGNEVLRIRCGDGNARMGDMVREIWGREIGETGHFMEWSR